jgi:hypothetical protein
MTTVEPDTIEHTTTSNELTHFVCCLTRIGDTTPALCGALDTFDGTISNHVDCVVCDDLSNCGWCPMTPDHLCLHHDEGDDDDD